MSIQRLWSCEGEGGRVLVHWDPSYGLLRPMEELVVELMVVLVVEHGRAGGGEGRMLMLM